MPGCVSYDERRCRRCGRIGRRTEPRRGIGAPVRVGVRHRLYPARRGIPFVLLALGYARSLRAFAWLRRHGRAVERSGGLVLVAIGVLMVTGTWIRMFAPLVRLFADLRWPAI